MNNFPLKIYYKKIDTLSEREWNYQNDSETIIKLKIETVNENADREKNCFSSVRTKIYLTAAEDIELTGAEISISHQFDRNDLFFLNGYQSWTDSFEYHYDDELKDVKKLPSFLINKFSFDAYGDAKFQKYKKDVFHSYDVSYVKGDRPVFIGNYNFDVAYLIVEYHKKEDFILLKSDVNGLFVNKNQTINLFDYILCNDVQKGEEIYFSHFSATGAKKLTGYTSWYNHYQNINEKLICDALENCSSEYFNIFQIDDGFEKYVGDWLCIDETKFPNGLKPIVSQIHKKNMKAGIWLAPFVAEAKSALFRENPSWFCKDNNGDFIKCGSNWSGFYALNLENVEVIDYIKKCLHFYVEMGFDFFKLDFLYAANVCNYEGKTRSQTAQKAYSLLRNELGDKLILGCGAIPSNSFGVFDYLRVGPDVSLIFDDVWFMRFMHRERISTKITIQNTIYRNLFNKKVFLNDPDVFLLRKNNIRLSEKQRIALSTINSLFGSLLMTSDNPKDYDEKQFLQLKEIFSLFQDAKNVDFETLENKIRITYEIKGERKVLIYDVKKGNLGKPVARIGAPAEGSPGV